MDDIIKWYAIGISNIVVMYDPELIVIQGIYTKAGDYFLNNLRERIKTISLPRFYKNVEIKYSKLTKEAGVIGGVSYIISEFF